jgi:hypothetical protein
MDFQSFMELPADKVSSEILVFKNSSSTEAHDIVEPEGPFDDVFFVDLEISAGGCQPGAMPYMVYDLRRLTMAWRGHPAGRLVFATEGEYLCYDDFVDAPMLVYIER